MLVGPTLLSSAVDDGTSTPFLVSLPAISLPSSFLELPHWPTTAADDMRPTPPRLSPYLLAPKRVQLLALAPHVRPSNSPSPSPSLGQLHPRPGASAAGKERQGITSHKLHFLHHLFSDPAIEVSR